MPGSERQVIGVCLCLVWRGNGSKVCRCQGMDFWDYLDDRKGGDTLLTPLRGGRFGRSLAAAGAAGGSCDSSIHGIPAASAIGTIPAITLVFID